MQKMERDGRLHVVILPHGELGGHVVDVVADWVATGMLEPAYWVTQDLGVGDNRGAFAISSTVMGRGTNGDVARLTVPLLDSIASEAVDEVIVTNVTWIGDDADRNLQAAQRSVQLLEAVRDSLPLGRSTARGKVLGTDVRSLNVIFAGTRVTSQQLSSLLNSRWDENLIVSPEDRQRPRGADRFTTSDDLRGWAGFIAATAMTLSGLWTGMSASPVPQVPGSGDLSGVPRVRVARTFTRAVMSDGFAVQLAASIVDRLAAPESPLVEDLVAASVPNMAVLPPEAQERALNMAVAYLMSADSSALTYRQMEPTPPLARQTMSWWQAQKVFFSFAWDRVTVLPNWLIGSLINRVNRSTTADLFGADGHVDVDVRLDVGAFPDARELIEPLEEIAALRQKVRTLAERPPLPVVPVNAPVLWTAMRNVSFALCDGGSDATDLEIPPDGLGRTLVVDNINNLIPSGDDRWTLPSDVAKHLGEVGEEIEVRWSDTAEATELLAHLSERTDELQARREKLQGLWDVARRERAAAESSLIEARDAEVDARMLVEDLFEPEDSRLTPEETPNGDAEPQRDEILESDSIEEKAHV